MMSFKDTQPVPNFNRLMTHSPQIPTPRSLSMPRRSQPPLMMVMDTRLMQQNYNQDDFWLGPVYK